MLANDASHAHQIQMTLASLLSSDRVVPEMNASVQEVAITELVDCLVTSRALPEEGRDCVLEALILREEDKSTGIGNGVAIPHCFSDDVEEVALVFGRSTEGIDFFSVDRALVHFVVLFVVPKAQYALHLKTLAAIAKIMNSAETRERLTKAADQEEILEILSTKNAQV